MANCLSAHERFIFVFISSLRSSEGNKHQNNTWEYIHHFISYTTKGIHKWSQKRQSSHLGPVSHSLTSPSADNVTIECWWCHNDQTIVWRAYVKKLSNSLDIDSIHGVLVFQILTVFMELSQSAVDERVIDRYPSTIIYGLSELHNSWMILINSSQLTPMAPMPLKWHQQIWARFLSLVRSKLRLCSANHRPGYWSNLPCDWPSTAWAYSVQETENGPWYGAFLMTVYSGQWSIFFVVFYTIENDLRPPSLPLTHWGRDKMDALSQTTFSRAFSSTKIVVFWLNFHWKIFARVQLTIIQHWFR